MKLQAPRFRNKVMLLCGVLTAGMIAAPGAFARDHNYSRYSGYHDYHRHGWHDHNHGSNVGARNPELHEVRQAILGLNAPLQCPGMPRRDSECGMHAGLAKVAARKHNLERPTRPPRSRCGPAGGGRH